MPKSINPIKKALVKQSLLRGNSIATALKDAKYSDSMIRGHNNSTSNKVVKSCVKEIVMELDKKGLIEEAYRVLKERLHSKLDSNKIAAATAILKFTEGEKLNHGFILTPEEQSEISAIKNRMVAITTNN